MATQPASNQLQLPLVLVHRVPNFDKFIVETSRFLIFDPLTSPDLTQSFLAENAQSVRVLLCAGHSPVNVDILQRLPDLECIVCTSAGIDHIDLSECRRRGIIVTNAGDAFSEDVADYAVALLISVLRRIPASDRYIRGGLWPLNGEYHPLGSKVSPDYFAFLS